MRCLNIFLIVLAMMLVFASAIDTSSVFLKVSLNQGSSVEKSISVTNDHAGEILLDILNVPGVTSEKSFDLATGERKSIPLKFDSTGLNPRVYAGRLRISDGIDMIFLPIVFEVESENVLFDLNLEVPPQYSEIRPGENLLAQIKIFDLISGGTSDGLGTSDVSIEYYIMDLDGNILSSINENVVVRKEARVTKSFPIPEDIEAGDYVLFAVARYRSSVGVSSQMIIIGKKSDFLNDLLYGGSFLVLLLLGVIILFFLALVALFVYMIKDRDRLILEIKKYNAWEIRRHKESIYRLAGNRNREKASVRAHASMSALEKRQKKRLADFEKFRKEGDTDSMKSRIKEWKKQGYNTLGLEKAVRSLTTEDMKKQLLKWREKGYRRGETEEYKKKK